MKKIISILLAMLLCSSISACGNDTTTTKGKEKVPEKESQFPILGVWRPEGSNSSIIIEEDGKMTIEMVATNTVTKTTNGVSTTSTSKSTTRQESTWSIDGSNFMFAKQTPYKMEFDGTDYKLVGAKTTYIKVNPEEEQTETEPIMNPDPYELRTVLKAEGLEMQFDEAGFYDDIKITSKSSGIQITSGPSPEEGKKFYALKGTLKNTGKAAVQPVFTGKAVLDGYEYEIKVMMYKKDAMSVYSVDPLDTVTIHIYCLIPDELVNSFSDGRLTFAFNDNFEKIENNIGKYSYYVNMNSSSQGTDSSPLSDDVETTASTNADVPVNVSISKVADNSAGTPELFVQFENLSDKKIVALDFLARCYDAYDELVEGYNRYEAYQGTYQEGIPAGGKTPSHWRWALYGFNNTQSVEIAVIKYKLDGEPVVEIPESQFVWVK